MSQDVLFAVPEPGDRFENVDFSARPPWVTEGDRWVTEGDRWVTDQTANGHPANQALTSGFTDRVTEGDRYLTKFPAHQDQVTREQDNSTRAGGKFAQNGHPRSPAPVPTTLAAMKKALGHPGWRGLTPRRCHRCRRHYLVGLDADVCAMSVHLDWLPLDRAGELMVILQGRHTYQLRHEGGRVVACRRPARLITARPPGGRDWTGPYDVVPAHACDLPSPPGIGTALITPHAPAAADDRCPF